MPKPRFAFLLCVTAVAGLGLASCSSDGSSPQRAPDTSSTSRRLRTTTTTKAEDTSTSASSGLGSSSTTATTAVTPPASSTPGPEPTGTCGPREPAISQAVLDGGLGPVPVENYTLTDCRIAPSNQIWGAVTLVPKPGSDVPKLTVVLERVGALWTVRAYGERNVACDAPAPVPAELRSGC